MEPATCVGRRRGAGDRCRLSRNDRLRQVALIAHFSGFREYAERGYNPRLACGGIAQLGERLHGMQEVIGSIPFTSTN